MVFLEGLIVREDFIEMFKLRCESPEKFMHANILGQNVLDKGSFYFLGVETLIRCL